MGDRQICSQETGFSEISECLREFFGCHSYADILEVMTTRPECRIVHRGRCGVGDRIAENAEAGRALFPIDLQPVKDSAVVGEISGGKDSRHPGWVAHQDYSMALMAPAVNRISVRSGPRISSIS